MTPAETWSNPWPVIIGGLVGVFVILFAVEVALLWAGRISTAGAEEFGDE